jgi:hypothetical protein
MKNVRRGGKLFFAIRGTHPMQISLWADFIDDPLVRIQDAWGQFGQQLGASTEDEWNDLVARLPAIRTAGQLRVIRGDRAFAPQNSISLQEAGIREIRHATKGWSIGPDDVNRILEFGGTPTATDMVAPPPNRVRVSVSRIIRDTQLSNDIKRWHNSECQICGHTIELADGRRYSEGHHIKPLGEPHNGPDTSENIICLCPNHHAACDLGAIRLSPTELRLAKGHSIGMQYIEYHNRVLYPKTVRSI